MKSAFKNPPRAISFFTTLISVIHLIPLYLYTLIPLVTGCQSPSTDTLPVETKKIINPNGRNDAWGFIGFGGGGATFYPAVSPHNPKVAFVSCDMTGSYSTTNGGLSWRMFTLHGVIHNYVFDPLDSAIVYALVGNHSGGLYKSADSGNTWSLLYPAPGDVSGIVAKGDHADEVMVTKDSTERNVTALAIDPENSKKHYATIQINEATAFYTSDDGGSHWDKQKDLKEKAMNIYVVPGSPKESRTVYITSRRAITVRKNGEWTVNNGPNGVKSLTEFGGGFDESKNVFVIYATSGKSYFNPEGDQSGIYYTDDGGASWQNRQHGLVSLTARNMPLPEWRSVATSALHPEVIYISYANLHVDKDTTCIGVAKSVDYGMTWTLVWKDKLVKGGDLHASNLDGGWINERYGPTWGENPFSIAVSAVNPDVCYTTDFGRVIKTEDGGKHWTQVYTKKKPNGGWTSRGIEVTCSYGVVFDPFDENHVFITNTDVGLMESNDRAESWESATKENGIPKGWINSTYWLTFDPEVKGRAWAAMSGIHDLPRPKMFRKNGTAGYKGGIVVTEDGGKSWKPISADIGEGALTDVFIDPSSNKDARTLYACAFGKGVYKSVDGGKSWRQKNNGIEGKEPFAWRITKRNQDGALFLIVCRRSEDGSIGNEKDGALYRSDNGAETWKKITLPEATNGPMSLVVDQENTNHLMLSAWGRNTKGKFTADIGGGIFISKDDGKTWNHVLQQDQHIHDITFDPRNKRYYACGFNGSAYRSEDQGESWQRIKGYNFKWGKRVDIDPRDPEKIFIITFGGGVWYGPAGGDADAIEDIRGRKIGRFEE